MRFKSARGISTARRVKAAAVLALCIVTGAAALTWLPTCTSQEQFVGVELAPDVAQSDSCSPEMVGEPVSCVDATDSSRESASPSDNGEALGQLPWEDEQDDGWEATCVSDCLGKECGDDGCGGSCGECQVGYACEAKGTASAHCLADCASLCEARACGLAGPEDDCDCGLCEDDVVCTEDACSVDGQCIFAPLAGQSCNDDTVCNGLETCAGGECLAGPPLDCNDGIACTEDGCNPIHGCYHSTQDYLCDDGLSCTVDSCLQGGCQHAIDGSYCVIGGWCIPEGTSDPTEPCRQCYPPLWQTDWTAVNNGVVCGVGKICWQGVCCSQAANCYGQECGDDLCGGSCGTCPLPGHVCEAGHCVCYPLCGQAKCGDDGCLGSCGECCEKQSCQEGACIWEGQDCNDGNCDEWDGCTWGYVSEFQVNQATKSFQTDVAVAGLQEGGFAVAWRGYTPETEEGSVMARLFDGGGSPKGNEFAVSPLVLGIHSFLEGLAVLSSGDVVFVFRAAEKVNGPCILRGRVFGPDGKPAGDAFPLAECSLGTVSLTGLSESRFAVVWEDGEAPLSDSHGIFGRLYDHEGNPLTDQLHLNNYTNNDQKLPQVAFTGNGGFAVVWVSDGQDGSSDGVVVRFFDKDGSAIGEEQVVNTATVGKQGAPLVAKLADGRLLVVFSDFKSADAPAMGRFYGADQLPEGSEVKLMPYGHGLRLAALADGGFALSKATGVLPPSAQRFSQVGQTMGDQIPLALFDATPSWIPLAALAPGGFVAVWVSDGQDGSGEGIFAQRLDAEGKKLVH